MTPNPTGQVSATLTPHGEPNLTSIQTGSTGPRPAAPHRYIELSDGTLFWPELETVFNPVTIAHSGAMACRFGGQCKDFYSVSQHGVLVSHIMDEFGGNPFEGLLHDASESFMLDMPTPIKRMLPDYMKLEKDLLRRIRLWAGLPEFKTPECEFADKMAMYMEAVNLISSQGATLDDPKGIRAIALDHRAKYVPYLTPYTWQSAKELWLYHYHRAGEVWKNYKAAA